jgi:peroxiredoxin
LPDIEDRIWRAYRDRGVEVVAIDANGDALDGVSEFVKNLGTTFTIGLEDPSTKTYEALVENFKGANPFPVDVVVGTDGKIRYIAREYDPEGLVAAVEAALAD